MNRRALHFQNLAEAVADVQELQQHEYEQLGCWSLATMLDHLNKTMKGAFEPNVKPLPAPIRWVLRHTVMRRLLSGKQLNFQASAPKELLPSDEANLEDAVAEFKDLCHRLESTDEEVRPINAAFGRFHRDDWIRLSVWHAGHHLSFLIPKSQPTS